MNIKKTLEKAITLNNSNSYIEIFNRLKPAVYVILSKYPELSKKAFLEWLFSWLCVQDKHGQSKLMATYIALINKIKEGDLKTEEEQLKYFINYLAKIIRRNAISEYHEEINVGSERLPVISLDYNWNDENDQSNVSKADYLISKFSTLKKTTILDYVDDADAFNIIKTVLNNKLPEKDAVPLILKSKPIYEFIGLSKKQLAWISNIAEMPVEQVSELIDDEFDMNKEKFYPLSSIFIANLIKINPDSVDQQFRRALIKLKIKLKDYELNN